MRFYYPVALWQTAKSPFTAKMYRTNEVMNYLLFHFVSHSNKSRAALSQKAGGPSVFALLGASQAFACTGDTKIAVNRIS